MFLNEKFISIEGEGTYTGIPTYFVRTQGCSIICQYCDTSEAQNRNNNIYDISVLLGMMSLDLHNNTGVKRISITGGNPMEQEDILSFSVKLKFILGTDYQLHIEHPGIILNTSLELDTLSYYDSIGFDIKGPSTYLKNDYLLKQIKKLNSLVELLSSNIEIYFKCVIYDIKDADFYKNIFNSYPNFMEYPIYFQPCYIDNKIQPETFNALGLIKDNIINGTIKNGRLGVQLHKILDFK